jgi:hypothetical protein
LNHKIPIFGNTKKTNNMETKKPTKTNKIVAIVLLLIALGLIGKYAGNDKEKEKEAASTYVLKPTDTVGTSMEITNKLGGMILSNRLNDMIAIATANLGRFEGADKADILDQRGGAYSMKQDYENAAKDYALVHQSNAAETYQSAGNKEKALEFANKVKNNPAASKYDLETVNKVIDALK